MFGPNQVGELIVGNDVATETTVNAFIEDAVSREIGLYSADGTAPTLGKPFYFLQKTDGDASKNLNFEFSDRITPKYIDKINVRAYAPEVMGSYKVDGFATAGVIAPLRTYEVRIVVEDYLSPENFDVISGYYITGEILGGDTPTTVRDGLLKSLNSKLKRRGGGEFSTEVDGTGFTITEKYQDNIPGKKDGRKLRFKVYTGVWNNISTGTNTDLRLLDVTQEVVPNVGTGTGKWATEYEYFVSGYKYDPNRLWAYPLDFNTPYYTSKQDKYHVIQIKYYMPRTETSVERQYKVLTVIVNAGEDGKSVTAVNDVLAKLRIAVGTLANVPGNLVIE